MNFDVDDERVEQMYGELVPAIGDLGAVEFAMTAEMLHQFCWYCVKLRDLEHTVEVEGIMEDTPKGPKANPVLAVMHQFAQRKGDLYSKMVKSVGKVSSDAASKLAKFGSRR